MEIEKITLDKLRILCSKSEKCRRDILEKLAQWNFEGDKEGLIKNLISEGFLNEERYVQAYVNDKIRFARWGKNKIIYSLKQKGIPENVIREAFENSSITDYGDIVEKELLKKFKSIKKGTEFDKKKKLYSFAIQRGYESDISLKIIERLISK